MIYNRSYPWISVYGTGANPANLVEGNVVSNGLEGISALVDTIVRNNIIMGSGCGLCIYNHAQVSQIKNITAVNNTMYNNGSGLYYRWSGSKLVLANNAIYSPGKTAVNSYGAINSTGDLVTANFVEGAMSRDAAGGSRFYNGGSSTAPFVNPASNDLWPRAGSPLIGAAHASCSPLIDFNGTTRVSPFDVGAYETNGHTANPGWSISHGFKLAAAQMVPPAAPINLRVE